jgi:asparagine synthase (glutamine-hydrolysing)
LGDLLRGAMREWAENLIFLKKYNLEDYLIIDSVKYIWKSYVKGNNHLTGTIWNILMFISWYYEHNKKLLK